MTARRRSGFLLALPLAGALALSACAKAGEGTGADAQSEQSPATSQSAATQSGGAALSAFMTQKIDWQKCAKDQIMTETNPITGVNLNDYQCATLKAPMDWSNPTGATIELAIGKHVASGQSKGALFFNLGGPGGAARASLASQVTQSMGNDLVRDYDVIALDPRGVGASTPIQCLSDQERDVYNASEHAPDTKDPQEIVDFVDSEMRKFGEGCLAKSGDLTGFVDTVSAAKDFDMVRSALGQEKFNYLGYSYGTFLGATYAGLYPDRVGRMVLDGALDPAASINDVSDMQMRGFEDSIQHWIEVCQSQADCPLTGTKEDGITQLTAFLDRISDQPLPTQDADRPLTEALAQTAIIGMLYSTQTYDVLKQGLTQALQQDDGSILLYLADFLNDRNDDGTYSSNGTDAIIAINSLDYEPVGTVEDWAADAAALEAELPVFGRYAGYGSAGLSAWPIDKHAARTPIAAAGAPPIVVIGTTHDPATPYAMAQSLAKQLESGVLVSWDGWDHTAYSKDGSKCVAGAVESFLRDGTAPEDGLSCTD